MSKPLVTYLRVSTAAQGESGLGLDAQREALARFAEAEGFTIVAEHVEVETGKGFDALDRRPKLAVARWSLPSSTACPATWPSSLA